MQCHQLKEMKPVRTYTFTIPPQYNAISSKICNLLKLTDSQLPIALYNDSYWSPKARDVQENELQLRQAQIHTHSIIYSGQFPLEV